VPEIYTIGHAARSWAEFVDLLHHQGITLLVDIRRFPGSRHAPQFNEETMRAALADEGIGYQHLPDLGGRRRALPDSPNTAWRHPSFRGYADYMETSEFQASLHELIELAQTERVAIMCAEAVWWKCHRSMVADALLAKGWQVWHILDDGEPRTHRFTAPARLVDGALTYRPDLQQVRLLPD
jgi:uncharacterized protein (DUF488 family)